MIFRIFAPAKAIETANAWSNYIDKTRELADELIK
jgi:hypothetical protein